MTSRLTSSEILDWSDCGRRAGYVWKRRNLQSDPTVQTIPADGLLIPSIAKQSLLSIRAHRTLADIMATAREDLNRFRGRISYSGRFTTESALASEIARYTRRFSQASRKRLKRPGAFTIGALAPWTYDGTRHALETVSGKVDLLLVYLDNPRYRIIQFYRTARQKRRKVYSAAGIIQAQRQEEDRSKPWIPAEIELVRLTKSGDVELTELTGKTLDPVRELFIGGLSRASVMLEIADSPYKGYRALAANPDSPQCRFCPLFRDRRCPETYYE